MGNETVSRRQLLTMAYISLLSPAIRVIPRLPAELAGKAAWLSPAAAVLAAAGIGWVFHLCLRAAGPQRGLAELMLDTFGPAAGRILLGVYVLWFVFDAGFVLRTAAERLISAVYSQGHLMAFLALTLLVSLVAACGRLGTLGRTAEVFAPVILLVLAGIFAASLFNMEKSSLLPVLPADIPQIFLGAAPMAEVMGVVIPFAFLADRRICGRDKGSVAAWMGATALSMAVLTVPVIGCLSAEVTRRLQNPFFIMLRNITVLESVDRIEPLVLGLWIITDFVFISSLLLLCGHLSGRVTGARGRKPFVLAAAALALAVSLLCGKSAFDMRALSDLVIPVANGVFCVAVPVLTLLAAAMKRAVKKHREKRRIQDLGSKSGQDNEMCG